MCATDMAHHHLAGTAAMIEVLNPVLRDLRNFVSLIIDVSILPLSIGGHPQATLYTAGCEYYPIIDN